MLEIKVNSVNVYIVNYYTNRVVMNNLTYNDALFILEHLVPYDQWHRMSYDPEVEYDIQHVTNEDLKFPDFVEEMEFVNILLDGKIIKTCIKGIWEARPVLEMAKHYKRQLEYYGVRLGGLK